MKPFDEYPGAGRDLIGPLKCSGGSKHGYGLDLQRRTGQTKCAYCGVSLVHDYHQWLLMSVDHVVPVADAAAMGVPMEFRQDAINHVLCCSACNALSTGYELPDGLQKKRQFSRLEDFVELRDEVFADRCSLIAERRAEDVVLFNSRPWQKAA